MPGGLRGRRKGTFGGARCRSREAMVRRDGTVLARSRQSSRPDTPLILQNRVKAAWLRRWSNVLAWSAARDFALSLLNKHPNPGTGAEVPQVHKVLRDSRFA